jgi:RNA recognition motif-containing protein
LKLFVGNLPFHFTENDLRSLFEPFGEVNSIQIITDRDTGRSRGFGFVEMSSEDGQKATAALNGSDVGGRAIKVNEARPKVESGGGFRPGGGGGRGDRGGFSRGRREPRW